LLWDVGIYNIQTMARQIRHNVEGGGYHITTRGMGRREIYSCDRDREHFTGLLQGLADGLFGASHHAVQGDAEHTFYALLALGTCQDI
jgi:hypothetical protein